MKNRHIFSNSRKKPQPLTAAVGVMLCVLSAFGDKAAVDEIV